MHPKPDGSYRFCLDFRAVNKVTKKDAYSTPRTDRILDGLRGARYTSNIDLSHAYYQIPLHPSGKEKTAFRVPGIGLYQFKRMHYGLTNAPVTFQLLVDPLFGPEWEPYVSPTWMILLFQL